MIWSLGNENGQIDGFQAQYELDMVAAIREAETCTAHMIGTNSEREELMASPKIDYIMLSPKPYPLVQAGGVMRQGMWPGLRPKRWETYEDLDHPKNAASDHAALWVDLDL